MLKAGNNHAGEGGGYHQKQQPGDAALPQGEHGGSHIGLLRGGDGGHLLHILRGLLLEHVQDIVHGDDPHEPLPLVGNGQAQQVIAPEQLRRGLLVRLGPDGGDILLHQLPHPLPLRGQDQVPQGCAAQELLRGIHHIAGVHRLLVHAGGADGGDGLSSGHVRIQGHVLHRHNAAGAVLGIAQQVVDRPAGLRVRLAEDAVDHRGGHILNEVRRVVGGQLIHHGLQLRVREPADQALLAVRVHLHEHLRRPLLAQEPEEDGNLILRYLLQQLRQIRRLHCRQHIPQSGVLLLLFQCA